MPGTSVAWVSSNIIIIVIIIMIIKRKSSCESVSPRDMVCLGDIRVNTLYKGDSDNNNNNNEFN